MEPVTRRPTLRERLARGDALTPLAEGRLGPEGQEEPFLLVLSAEALIAEIGSHTVEVTFPELLRAMWRRRR